MKRATLIVGLAVLFSAARGALAQSTITYTVSATASGSLGSASFTDVTVTINFVSNPTTVFPAGPSLNENVGTGTVTIAGVGTAVFLSGPVAFDLQGNPFLHSCLPPFLPCIAGIAAGIAPGPSQPGPILLGTSNAAFQTYYLFTPVGPISGPAIFDSFLTVPTTLGGLNFTSVGATSTFTATVPVPFAAFTAEVEITAGPPPRFELKGAFTLGTGATSIDPPSQAVTLKVGTYTVTIPAGSFQAGPKGIFTYEGVINGATLELRIAPKGANAYTIQAEGSGVDLTALTNPVAVTLTVGNNSGTTSTPPDF